MCRTIGWWDGWLGRTPHTAFTNLGPIDMTWFGLLPASACVVVIMGGVAVEGVTVVSKPAADAADAAELVITLIGVGCGVGILRPGGETILGATVPTAWGPWGAGRPDSSLYTTCGRGEA